MNLRAIFRWCLRILPILYMGLIWFLSDRPSDAVVRFGPYDGVIKESLHLVEFGMLYGLWVLAVLTFGPLSLRANRFIVIVSIMYGIVDEVHQYFVPSRSADMVDVIKDAIGVCVAWFIVHRTYFNDRSSKIGYLLRAVTEMLASRK